MERYYEAHGSRSGWFSGLDFGFRIGFLNRAGQGHEPPERRGEEKIVVGERVKDRQVSEAGTVGKAREGITIRTMKKINEK